MAFCYFWRIRYSCRFLSSTVELKNSEDRPIDRAECCRPTFVSTSRRFTCSPALCAEQCAAPAIICRFVSDRFLGSYIFHVGLRAFPRVAPLKVSTTAKRFAIFLPGFVPGIVGVNRCSPRSLSLSLFLSLSRSCSYGKSLQPGDPINFDNCTADYCISDVRLFPFLVITDFCRRNVLSGAARNTISLPNTIKILKIHFYSRRRRSAHIVFNKPEEL